MHTIDKTRSIDPCKILPIAQVSQQSIKYVLSALYIVHRYVILNIFREEEIVGLQTEYRK